MKDNHTTDDALAALLRISIGVTEIRRMFPSDHPTADDELEAILEGISHATRWIMGGALPAPVHVCTQCRSTPVPFRGHMCDPCLDLLLEGRP